MANFPYRTALIVGAGPGISASLARRLSALGVGVGLAARDVEKLKGLADETGAKVFGASPRNTPLSEFLARCCTRFRPLMQRHFPQMVRGVWYFTAGAANDPLPLLKNASQQGKAPPHTWVGGLRPGRLQACLSLHRVLHES